MKNAFYGFVSYLWPILFSFIITPIIIRKLGIEQYGLYTLTLVFSSFFSLLNFGLVYAFVQALAKIRNGATNEELRHVQKLYGATVLVFMILGFFSLLLSAGIAHFSSDIFHLSGDERVIGKVIFYFMGITAFFNSIAVVYSHIPYALQRQDIGTGIYVANIIVTNMLIVAALFFGYGLLALVGLQTISALLSLAATFWYSRMLLPDIKPEFTLKKEIVKPMFRFGGYIYLHNISASFLSQIDRIIIGGTLGPAALTLYALPNSVAEKTQGVTVSLSGILFPVMSELAKEGDITRVRSAYHKALRMIALLAASLTTTILLFADKTLLFWVGKDVAAQSTHLIYWLAPTYFLLALFLPTTHVLAGIGRVKFLGLSSLVMAILNIVLLIILLPVYGITGAAMAYFFGLIPLVFIFYFLEKYFLKEQHACVFYFELFAKLFVTSIVFVGFGVFLLKPFVTDLITLLVMGVISVVAYVGIYKFFGFLREDEWERFKEFSRNFFTRISYRA